MKFLKTICFLIGLSSRISLVLSGTKPDFNGARATWYIPSTARPVQRSDSIGDSYYNYNTISGSQLASSFTPTSALVAQPSLNYQQQYNGYQNQVDATTAYSSNGNQLSFFSYGNPAGAADDRQEFSGPGPTGDGGVGGGIFNTASNIAQGIGLGGLGVAGSIIVLAVGFPLIALAVLFPIAVLVLAILAFPVLKLTLPPTDPNLARTLKSGMRDVAGRAMEVFQSEECIERLSCQLARKARKLPYEDWILEKMNESGRAWTTRFTKSVKAGRDGENCDNFKCSPVSKVSEFFVALKNMRSSK